MPDLLSNTPALHLGVLDIEDFGLMITGFVFVLLVLAILSGVTAFIGYLFKKAESYQAGADGRKAAKEAAKIDAGRNPAGGFAEKTVEIEGLEADTVASLQRMVLKASPETSGEGPVEPDPNLPAVIAAAVHIVLSDLPAYRIISVRDLSRGWAQEGRRQIFSSHRLR